MAAGSGVLIGRSLGEKRLSWPASTADLPAHRQCDLLAAPVFFQWALVPDLFHEPHIVDMGVTLVRGVIVLIVIVQIAQG